MSGVDLVLWLTAQLDEDERITRTAGDIYGGSHDWRTDVLADSDYPAQHMLHIGERTILAGLPGEEEDPFRSDELEHIARHDPARVLREIDAKRQIVDMYGAALEEREGLRVRMREVIDKDRDEFGRLHQQESGLIERARMLAPVVHLLALPYADREGYAEAVASAE